MFVELLANRHRAAGVGFDGGHARRWGRRLLAENALHDPRAAEDRRGGGAVGGDLENSSLRHQPATHAVLRQRGAAQSDALRRRRAVVRGEALVEHGEVRRDEIARRQIAAQQFGEEELCLRERGFRQQIVEVIVGI